MPAPARGTRTILGAGAAALLLALTTAPSLAGEEIPPGTAMDAVRSRLGVPNAIRFDGAGAQSWEYVGRRAPSGAYRLTFDAAGTVREAVALRSPERIAQVRAGLTTAEELVTLLGEPARISIADGDTRWHFSRAGATSFSVRLGADRRVVSITGLD